MKLSRHSLPFHKSELVIVALFYFIITITYLWFAVRPAEFSSRLQTLDAVLMAAIADHVASSPFDPAIEFWDFGIFYPLERTLCLSEPMITPAVLMAPVTWLSSWVVATNLWIYLCWWSLAMACWWYLRLRKCDALAAVWAGLFVSFSPDRSWHLAGHEHLYYQSGLFLALIGMERALTGGGWRWKLLYFFGVISQIFAGIYISAIALTWGFVVIPVIALAIIPKSKALGTRINWHFLWIAPMVGLSLFAPILKIYSDYGKNRGQNPIENLISGSATPSGYLLPPTEPERLITPLGKIIAERLGSQGFGEDCQYLGLIAFILLGTGAAISAGTWRRWNRNQFLVIAAVGAAGVVCLIFSFGPTWNHAPVGSRRLPFSYLYGWFEPFRFFRAPSRFAFGVQWSVAILGAISLTALSKMLREGANVTVARTVGILCIGITLIDFYPRGNLPRYDVKKSAFSEWLVDNPQPYLIMPTDTISYLGQYGWNHVPVANGYSGYAPDNRLQDLAVIDKHFPEQPAIALMSKWNIKRVLVQPQLTVKADQAIATGKWREIWRGTEGTVIEYGGPSKSVADYRAFAEQVVSSTTATIWQQPIRAITDSEVDEGELGKAGAVLQMWNMEPHPKGGWRTATAPASAGVIMTKAPISPLDFSQIRIRYRITDWYSLREPAALYWSTVDAKDFNEQRKVEFVLQGDGAWHDLTVPLHDRMAWISSSAVRTLRLDLSYRTGSQIELETLLLD